MISVGRPVLIIVGVLFVMVAIGSTVTMRIQMRSAGRQGNRRQRLRYRSHIVSTRRLARQVAAAQREHAALIYPDPDRLWAIASTYARGWERRAGDGDFLCTRVRTGDDDLVAGMQSGGQMMPP